MLRSKQHILNRNPQPLNHRSDKFDFCRISSTNSPFYAKRTQFRKHPKSPQLQFLQRITKKQPLRQPPKANPNEPKRTQSKPNFSPKNGTQSQSKPTRTQNKANRTQSEALYEARVAKPDQTQNKANRTPSEALYEPALANPDQTQSQSKQPPLRTPPNSARSRLLATPIKHNLQCRKMPKPNNLDPLAAAPGKTPKNLTAGHAKVWGGEAS